jgi:uncharacterized protein YcbK (DUF882 family)
MVVGLVTEYALDRNDWVWENFKPEEVLSPHGLQALHRGILVIQPDLLDVLEGFRASIGKPILINHDRHKHRGYRSPKENLVVHGEPFSFHIQGLAADITVPDMPIAELHQLCLDFPDWTGIGYYPRSNFIHVDIRPLLGTWNRRQWLG